MDEDGIGSGGIAGVYARVVVVVVMLRRRTVDIGVVVGSHGWDIIEFVARRWGIQDGGYCCDNGVRRMAGNADDDTERDY